MLVPFAIDTESLEPDGGWTPAQMVACHRNLLDTWQRVGILVHDGEDFSGSRIKKAIDALPQKLRPLWQELVGRLPMLPADPQWDGIARNSNGTLDALAASANVALLDDVKAEVEFGLDEAELSRVLPSHPRLEFCRLLAAPQARFFEDAMRFSGRHIPAKQTYTDLWESRFAVLARAPIKQIAIVDRYAVSQHYECPQDKLSGLERFLRLLDTDATGKRYVTLYSAWTSELNQPKVTIEDVQAELRGILDHLPKGHVRRVKIVMLPNADFGQLHHDRFVRFGDYVWDIGLGVKVFEGAFVAEQSTAGFKAGLQADSYKQAEAGLSVHVRAKSIDVAL